MNYYSGTTSVVFQRYIYNDAYLCYYSMHVETS